MAAQGDNVGSIYYEVAADTSKLTSAEKAVSDSMDKMSQSTGKADAAVDKLTAKKTKLVQAMDKATQSATKQRDAFSGLTGVIAAYLSLRTVQTIAALSDAYQQNASRIRNATTSTAEYEQVQARLLETANGTFRSLGEAQEVYIAVSDTLKALKFNTQEVLDITDSFSYALVRDAARADQAVTAMDAWSKALQKGKIEADAWASIMAAIPSIADGIAAATGKTAQQIRTLGATGKLSIEALNEGLLTTRDTNKKMAEEMAVSTKDAVTQLTNSFTVFFGKVNEASKASNVFTDNVAEMAKVLQDPATINAAVEFANGIVKAMNWIIKGAKETVNFVRWMAEEVAFASSGKAAAGDTVRQEQQIANLEQRITNLRNSRKGFALLGANTDAIDAQIAALEKEANGVRELMKQYKQLPTAPETVVTADAPKLPRVPVNPVAKGGDKKGANEAEKARKAEEARAKAAQDYINKLSDQLDKLDDISNVEEVLRDITRGSVKLKGEEVAKALEVARALDERIEKEKDVQDALNKENTTLAAQRQLQAEILGYSLRIAASVMGSGAAGEMEERARMEEGFARRIQAIQDQRRQDLAKATDKEKERINKQYDDTLEIERQYQAKSIGEYEKFTARKKELEGDWRVGALKAMADYKEAAENTAALTQNAFTNAMSAMEDALLKFAQTGKFNFSDFARSVINDIAKIAAKSATTGIMGLVGKFVESYFGTPSTGSGGGGKGGNPLYSLLPGGGGGGGGLGLKLPGRANGGPVESGKMYRVNERGDPELLNVGGNQYLMMGNQNGRVTNTSGSNGSGGPAVSVNVYNNTDSEVSATESQGPDGTIIDIVVKRAVTAVADNIARGGTVGNTIQSTFALSRGAGTTRFK